MKKKGAFLLLHGVQTISEGPFSLFHGLQTISEGPFSLFARAASSLRGVFFTLCTSCKLSARGFFYSLQRV